MARRIKWIFLTMMMLCTAALAAEGAKLPQAVQTLCESAHPGYAIAAYHGWGNEDGGQFALILKQGDDNILCVAEKEKEDAEYRLTIDNTNAVYDGNVLPGLLIDTGGDALFYTYHDVNGRAAEHYHTDKDTGSWSAVDATIYLKEGDEYHSILSFAADGELHYQHSDEDEIGNVFRSWDDAPIPVGADFEKSLLPQHFDIHAFDPDPTDGLYPMTKNEAFARSQAEDGETLKDMDISRSHLARLFAKADGTFCLTIDEWNPAMTERVATLGFSDEAVLDTYHAGEGEVFVSDGVMMYSIERVDEGGWVIHGVDDSGVRSIGPDYAAPDGQTIVYRNDGYIYGKSPWGILRGRDVRLEDSYEEMVAQLDQSAYALVHNPNPEDRLHLRAKPDKGSHSYGKFYNRTPVLVLERGEPWTKVQIGRGGMCLTGYMMTKYLAFDEEEKAQLACAFPQKLLLESHPRGIHMYAEHKDTAVTERMFAQESNDFIIGVSGDEWYIVLRADGAVGYVPQHAFWDGNG